MKSFKFKITKKKLEHKLQYIKDLPSGFDFTGKLVTRLGSKHVTEILATRHYEYPYAFKEINEAEGFCGGVINSFHLRDKDFYLLVKAEDYEI